MIISNTAIHSLEEGKNKTTKKKQFKDLNFKKCTMLIDKGSWYIKKYISFPRDSVDPVDTSSTWGADSKTLKGQQVKTDVNLPLRNRSKLGLICLSRNSTTM